MLAIRRWRKFNLLVIFIMLFLAGFLLIITPKLVNKSYGDTGDQVISDPAVIDFANEGFSYAKQLYGEPKIPVKKVILRFAARPLTQIVNAEQGIFNIELLRRPNEYSFSGQLAHEIAHLLNARLFDCYAEGLATVFAEKMVVRKGLDWGGWLKYFQQGNEPFYGSTYLMVKEMAGVAGPDGMKRFLNYANYMVNNKDLMYVDIDKWLKSLGEDRASKIKVIISKYFTQVNQSMSIYPGMSCRKPA